MESNSESVPTSSRDVEMELSGYSNEEEYRSRWTLAYIDHYLLALPEDALWNSMVCVKTLLAIIFVAIDVQNQWVDFFDMTYNLVYAMHVLVLFYCLMVNFDDVRLSWWMAVGFLVDIISFLHYFVDKSIAYEFKLIVYYLRLHRPFEYLWSMSDNNKQGSVLGTTLKYCYIFFVLRITWALISLFMLMKIQKLGNKLNYVANRYFLNAVYSVNKMFLPLGLSTPPSRDIERTIYMLVMITGCLVVTGAAVASLSLVISIYMRPEETFRTRFRLIMKEMKTSNIPQSLREKVETFYKMYWHKQRAVSATELLPIFPPSLTATIYTDIYFKATQKSCILRDLSYQFLSELAKKMETIHYIPGDAIIKRNHRKSSVIYITYGDIEMLTAEDDITAMLRMIRGTVLSPCGGCPAAGSGRAHVEIRAATFCTAHVLHVKDLWSTVLKYGRENGQGTVVLRSFNEHFEKVKRHFYLRYPEEAKYKSSILHFKRNLMMLKESKDAEGNPQLSETDVMIEIAGCYIMRNRADASLTDEADAICLRPTFPCILQPKSSLQIAWNAFVTCLIITVCITHPYYLVYQKVVPIEFRFYDYVVTVIYILDLIVHLSTGANVEDGVPITFSQTSSQQARNKWFVLDVIGTLPIFEFIHDGHFAGLNKLLRLPKVFIIFKSIEDECVYHSNFLRFMSFSLLLILACYFLSALQQGFMCFQFGYCLVTNFTHPPYWDYKPLDDVTIEDRLTFGFYWAISMITFTTHLETWGTKNRNSLMYSMFVMEICIVLYIFIESVYSATIMVTTALREDFDACIESVTTFLIRNEVDPLIRDRFIEYLQLRWYTDKAYSITNKQNSIFYDLPAHVYQDIVARQRSKYILCIPFMKLIRKEDLKTISSNAKLFCTSPNEILLNTGDISNEMYVIKQGICEILSPKTKDVVAELSVRQHFGVIECLLRLPAFYTVRAVTHVEVFSISRKYLMNAIDIPQITDAIDFCKELPQYASLQTRSEPFISYQPAAPAPNMEKFRLPRKYEKDLAFLQPFDRLGMLSVLRYIFPRFTIRPDGDYLVRHEWFRGCCALMSAIVYPCYTYMVLQCPWLYYVALLLDFTAYFDILQRMLVGYYNDKGILVYHPASTAAHYIKGAFMIDLGGALPLERLESSSKEYLQGRYKEAPIKQFLMLNRVAQLYRVPGALLGLEGFLRRDILLLIKAIPLFLALVNVLTCCIVYCSVEIFYSTKRDSWSIVPYEDVGGSWIHLFHDKLRFNVTESPWNLHLAACFWVVYETTTTGYSSFKPSNIYIMRVLIVGMVIGALMTTYFSVRIISIRANVNTALASFQEHMKDISVFMKREKLNSHLKRCVLDYYTFNWDKTGGMYYRNVLKLCDQITLRTDAMLHIYGPTFAKCPILNQHDLSLLRIIGRGVRSVYFLRNTKIIEVDDVISDIYILDQGSVEVNDPRSADNVVALTKGSIFGNLLEPSSFRCPVSMKTTTQVHLLRIKSHMFFSIINDFPTVLKLMSYYRPANETYINGIESFAELSVKTSPIMFFRGQDIAGRFHIKQSFFRIYLILVSLSCIYADIYNVGFQNNSHFLIIALYLLDFGFLFKFLIEYFLPSMVDSDDEDILRNTIRAQKKFFKYEFKVDIMSFLPIEILCLLSESKRGKWFSWLRLNRLLRIVTVYKCLKRHHQRISINLPLTTICTVFIWFTMFVHMSTCLWYYIGMMEEANNPKSSWMFNEAGRPWCENYYFCSLYFVLTTFTQSGVGDILPKMQSEVIFVSLLQLISTMMYMVYVGELSNIIQYQSYRSFHFYSSYLELQEYLKNNRVSRVLVRIVNKYLLHLWRESRGLQVPYFLTKAPPCLKLKIMSAAYLYHLSDHQLFKSCEPAFLRQLVGYLQLYTYNEDMYVVKESEITDSMYIIHTGRVKETRDNSNSTKTYQEGEYFGELQGLTHDLPFANSYKTEKKSQILTLHLHDWEDLLKHFPKSKETIYKYLNNDTYDDNDGDDYDGKHQKLQAKSNDSSQEGSHRDIQNPDTTEEDIASSSPTSTPDTKERKSSMKIIDRRNQINNENLDLQASKMGVTHEREHRISFKTSLDEMPTTSVKALEESETLSEQDRASIHTLDNYNKEDSVIFFDKRTDKSYENLHELKSVEDYILETHRDASSASFSRKVKEEIKGDEEKSLVLNSETKRRELKSSRKKLTEQVRLQGDSDAQLRQNDQSNNSKESDNESKIKKDKK